VEDNNRLAALETRVSMLEDQLSIYQLLMTYGPSADSGSDDVVRSIHHDDAEYDNGFEKFVGSDSVAKMIASQPLHREIMTGGSAHIATLPIVRIDGDRAVALCYGQVLRYEKDDNAFRIWRTTAVRLEFRRVEDGWRIYRRANVLLDGSEQSHRHFRDGLRDVGALTGEGAAE
jgi:hypothetical protein